MVFYVGLHQPADAKHFENCLISVNRLSNRKSDFKVNNWIMDSGAFTEVLKFGEFRTSVKAYASQVRRWAKCGNLVAAVAQDYVCAPVVLQITGLTVADHQRITIERYDQLLKEDLSGVYLMPVLQGNKPAEYIAHIRAYGERLPLGAWVGVGSVVSKSSDPIQVETILSAILQERPDLRLHGFGIKNKSFTSPAVIEALGSSDSIAWSFAARKQGRNQNDYREALRYVEEVNRLSSCRSGKQLRLF